jgi:quinolinate synthase
MKMNTLVKLHACLETLEPQIEVPEDIRLKAEAAVVRMLEQSK